MTINLAICDDNVKEIQTLSVFLEQFKRDSHPEIKIHTFHSGFSLLDAIGHGARFDIAILDIIIPGENGIDIARELRTEQKDTEIIFLTSIPEYAVESYEVHANNYILKPTQKEILFSVLTNCLNDRAAKQDAGFVICSGRNQYTRIPYSRLIYGEVIRKSVYLHLAGQKMITSIMTFTELLKTLKPCPDFIHPHRSYVVNMHYIEHITKKELILISGEKIPLPKNNYEKISKQFFDFSFSNSFDEGDV